ncbi:TIGR03943 family putative permease subunit [Streptococcus cuniculipharyngis]|uniref:TIGR03943 family protein n=1 Tax=Streptococcus cuniculipharyngis TaxID=1562651 RepID=A0A5C5SE53_9STRE|nr:TIGR03943 family protein [Streptococcus cuniculipharyngis]TWS98071.1 TIGR03943 family protein [Streptococcus cuniculipharyngis]
MSRFFILAGYFELAIYLQLTGKLDQYISRHYRYLVYLSMVLSLFFLLNQLYIWMKESQQTRTVDKKSNQLSFILLSFPLLVGFFLPQVSLDSSIVEAKGYHFPTALPTGKTSDPTDDTNQQYLKPDSSSYFTPTSYQQEMTQALKKYDGQETITINQDNYMEVLELIYLFPQQFVNRQISLTGFVYNKPKSSKELYLFRFGIIHCIADSGVYGLLTKGYQKNFPDNSWLRVTGTLHLGYQKDLNQRLPFLQVSQVALIDPPDNPYVYRAF